MSERNANMRVSALFMSPTAHLDDTRRYKTHTTREKMSSIKNMGSVLKGSGGKVNLKTSCLEAGGNARGSVITYIPLVPTLTTAFEKFSNKIQS